MDASRSAASTPAWRPDAPAVRVARVAVLGLVGAALAGVAHGGAGGAGPGVPTLGAAALVAAVACWPASRRRLSPLRCALVPAAVQLTLHLTATAGEAHAGAGMIIAHVVAAAAFGLWLALGEAALWRASARLVAAVAAGVRQLARRLVPQDPAGPALDLLPRRRPDAAARPAPRAPLRDVLVRRGPPRALPA